MRRNSIVRRRNILAFATVSATALAAVIASAALAGGRAVTLMLDWSPNPDHVGFYYARDTGLFAKAGLDVSIRAPSDPTAPLKLVSAWVSTRVRRIASGVRSSCAASAVNSRCAR